MSTMPMTAQIDEVLRGAVDRGDVPNVVAMAAGDDGVIYRLVMTQNGKTGTYKLGLSVA